jgi:hypothetical protein
VFTIGEFSRITGLTVKALRFYHVEGLLLPSRVDKLGIRISPTLAFDADKKRFVENDAANALLTRKYRELFVVPEKV